MSMGNRTLEKTLEKQFRDVPDARRREIAIKTDLILVEVIKSGADAKLLCKSVTELNSLKAKERELVLMNLLCRNLSLVNDLHNKNKSEKDALRAYA